MYSGHTFWTHRWLTVSLVAAALLLAVLAFVSQTTATLGPTTGAEQPGPLAASAVYSHTLYLPLVTAPLRPYIDHFDDPSSGWYEGSAIRWGDWCEGGVCHEGWEEVAYMYYASSHYHIYIPPTWHGPSPGVVDTWFVQPVQFAPLPPEYYPLPENYCIELSGFFANAEEEYEPWWAHWGIVFGATADMSNIFTYQINANEAIAALEYENYTYPGNRQPLDGSYVNVEIRHVPWYGEPSWDYPSTRHNTLRIAVNGEDVKLYINGRFLRAENIDNIPRDRIGVIGGVWEVTPADIAFDYFKYVPNCTE